MKKSILLWLAFACASALCGDGLVHSNQQDNGALLIGVANGLPGIGNDIDYMKSIVGNGSYNIQYEVLRDTEGTPEKVAEVLTRLSREYSGHGSLFFYYSGHGNVGIINTHKKNMAITEIRDAIQAGISLMGPLKRLTLFFDSCRSGSLIDPLQTNERMADEVVRVFTQERNGISYWEELFVLTSARASENCLAGASGSAFTRAVKKAYDEIGQNRGTVGEFLSKVESYTSGSHPTYRLVPEGISSEELVPPAYSASSGGKVGVSTFTQ